MTIKKVQDANQSENYNKSQWIKERNGNQEKLNTEICRKKKVGAGIGATPTWGYCVCCYL